MLAYACVDNESGKEGSEAMGAVRSLVPEGSPLLPNLGRASANGYILDIQVRLHHPLASAAGFSPSEPADSTLLMLFSLSRCSEGSTRKSARTASTRLSRARLDGRSRASSVRSDPSGRTRLRFLSRRMRASHLPSPSPLYVRRIRGSSSTSPPS